MENKLDKIKERLESFKEQLEKAKDVPGSLDSVKNKLKAEMDKRNFGEADATKHVIDRDRGEKKIPIKPKGQLLQAEDFTLEPTPNHDDKDNVFKAGGFGGMGIGMMGRFYHKFKDPDANTQKIPRDVTQKGEMCKYDKNGQWKIEKSGYGPKGAGLYNPNLNAERKKNNTGDAVPDAGKNVNVKSWTTTGSSMGQAAASAEAARQAAANKVAPVKTLKDMSPEEQAKIMANSKKRLKKSSDNGLEKMHYGTHDDGMSYGAERPAPNADARQQGKKDKEKYRRDDSNERATLESTSGTEKNENDAKSDGIGGTLSENSNRYGGGEC